MKKITLIKSLIFVVLIFVLSVTVTYAWISYSEDIDGGPITAGDIDYNYVGGFIDDTEVIFPNKELLGTAVSVNNQSDIDTSLRLTISYTLVEETVSTKVYKAEAIDDLVVVFDSTFVLDGDYWYYQATDYAINTVGSIDLISSIYYDGFKASNEYSTQNVTLTLTIQVKQAENVDWIDLTTIDFNG